MANNYTVVSSSTLEYSGDSVAATTIPTSNLLTIIPDNNYVIAASDFTIGSALPIEVTSVTFADTTTAYDFSNHVLATVTLAQWYVMPASNDTVEVDIDGNAFYKPRPRLSFTTVNNVIGSQVARFIVGSSSSATVSEATVEGVKTHTLQCDIPVNSKALVGTAQFVATDDGFFNSLPQYKIISSNPSKWGTKVISKLYGDYDAYLATPSDNYAASPRNGEVNSYTIEFYYEMGEKEVPLSTGESIIFTQPTETLWSTQAPVVSINKARYSGYKNQGILPSRNTDLSLNVLGSPGATYDILVMDDNGLSYDFTSSTFTEPLTTSGEQTINLGSPTVTTISNDHAITFYAYDEKRVLSKYLTTTVTPTGNTKTTVDGTSVDPYIITLNQFGEVDFTVNVTASENGVAATTATVLSFLNKTPLSHPTTFKPSDFPLLSTVNNSYFNISTPLSYSVTDTVDGAFSGTAMVMDTSHATKLVLVGDTVSGNNIDSGTVVSAINVGDNVKAYTLNQASSTGPTPDGATITFTRNVGVSRQPLASDFQNSTQSNSYKTSSEVEYQVTQATTNSTVVNVFDADSDYSLIYNGQTVQGDSIDGYPTVVGGGGSNSIVLSSFQTIPSGEILYFSNAMSYYEIIDISVTGANTSDCKLNIEGHINRVGHDDVVESLILDNFLTSYVAPIATALTVECVLGDSIKIVPEGVSNTGIIKVAGTGGRVSSSTISTDGSYLIYRAPATGTTETITYTISDGVSTSASANIVVTLT
tara:strand:+ start:2041 stop:4320 length:2280 start_codon:yes stop_codon:yes gene_type:complete